MQRQNPIRQNVIRQNVIIGSAMTLVSVLTLSLIAQTPAPAPKPAAPKAALPRTAWGTPDLQGTWFVMEDVPMQRSAANANKPFLSDEEVAAADAAKGLSSGRNARSDNKNADVTGAYNAVFNSILRTSKRTSMIIDPPDGKIPPTVASTQARGGGRGAGAGRGAGGGGIGGGAARGAGAADNPETAGQLPGGSAMVRCLGVTMPFLPINTAFAQGTVMQIVQSPKSMGIYMEDDHSGGGNRVIYMDGRPHLPASIKTYLGDSRGHWEGDTLVIETTNFSQGYNGSNIETYKMIERYTRTGPDKLRREITFDDPKTWTRPWTIMIEMGKTDDKRQMIFDSACHEGNYGMVGMLVGARREEAAAAKK